MLTLYHGPQSRSSRIVTLLDELGALDKVRIHEVDIARAFTGGGARDAANPHPEGKVPYIVDNGVGIRETPAIRDWATRCLGRPALARTAARDEAAMKALA